MSTARNSICYKAILLGIAAAWVNRGGKALPGGAAAPEFMVVDLRELVAEVGGG